MPPSLDHASFAMNGVNQSILAGMRVIEMSAFVAAPLGGMTLAQLGADVIRIDPPGGGLDFRRWPVSQNNVSFFWCGLNKGKRSVVIDIARPEGCELVQALICEPMADAGILLTNFPPRGVLDYESLRSIRADLIQLTIQGNHSGSSAVDYTLNPRLGLPFLTGSGLHDEVVNHVLPAWDLVTGHMAAVGLLAAERHRRLSQEGQHVKLALEDMGLAVMGHLGFIAEAQQGIGRERYGNYLFGAFGRDFITADDQRIMIVGLTLRQWSRLCRATGLQSQLEESAHSLGLNFSVEGDRFKAREQIAALLEPWIAARPLPQVAAMFDAAAVCWSKYQTVQELVKSDPACSTANPMFSWVDQPGVGCGLIPGSPLDFSGVHRAPPKPAPILGEHTEEVLLDVLRLSTAEFGRLSDRKIVRLPQDAHS